MMDCRCEFLETRTLLSLIFASDPPLTTSDAGGPVLAEPHVALVFWGERWLGTPAPSMSKVFGAAKTIVSSAYTRDLASYRPELGAGGSLGDSFLITESSPPQSFTNEDVSAFLQRSINADLLPRPTVDPHRLYVVVPQAGSNSADGSLIGSHSFASDDQGSVFYYAWTINDESIDTISLGLSGEIVGAMSNPEGTAIQVNPRNPAVWNEITDGAALAYRARFDGVLVQSYWLQSKGAHVVGTGAQDISNIDGHLILNGDQLANKDDTIEINFAGSADAVAITLNSASVSLLDGAVDDIAINGLTGGDRIRVSSGLPMTVNGGDGTDTITFDHTHDVWKPVLAPSIGDDTVVANLADVVINESQRLGRLDIHPLGEVFVHAPLLTVTSLNVGGFLDLRDNDMIVDYAVGTTSPLFFIERRIRDAWAGGWFHPGITTRVAPFGLFNTTLGAISASQYKSIYGPAATFAGQAIDNSAVLVKYTYYGDADFNGVVNFDDFARIDAGFNNERSGWLNGDFDYSGAVDFDDYSRIDHAFRTQTTPLRPPNG